MIHPNSEQLAISLAKIINQPLDFDIHCQLKRGTDMVDPVTGELLYSVGNVGRLEIFVDNVPFIDLQTYTHYNGSFKQPLQPKYVVRYLKTWINPTSRGYDYLQMMSFEHKAGHIMPCAYTNKLDDLIRYTDAGYHLTSEMLNHAIKQRLSSKNKGF